MKKIKEYFADFDATEITTRRVRFLEILVAFLIGVIIGILIAPPRKLKMGCNNGNNNVADGCGCGNGGCSCGNSDDDDDDDDKKEEEE